VNNAAVGGESGGMASVGRYTLPVTVPLHPGPSLNRQSTNRRDGRMLVRVQPDPLTQTQGVVMEDRAAKMWTRVYVKLIELRNLMQNEIDTSRSLSVQSDRHEMNYREQLQRQLSLLKTVRLFNLKKFMRKNGMSRPCH